MVSKKLYKLFIPVMVLLLVLSATSVSFAEGSQVVLQNGWFGVTYLGMTDNGDGTSTWSYQVDELGSGKGFKDLSHWVLGLGQCAVVTSASPTPYEVVKDPRTGVYGIKWDVGNSFKSGVFSFTLQGVWAETSVQVATKAGPGSDISWITGPSCESGGGNDDGGGE